MKFQIRCVESFNLKPHYLTMYVPKTKHGTIALKIEFHKPVSFHFRNSWTKMLIEIGNGSGWEMYVEYLSYYLK